MPIPADILPYIQQALSLTRKRLAFYTELIAESPSPSPEEIDFWTAQQQLYSDTETALLAVLQVP